ncbi:MAG: response regulator transcription factor [Prevotella sp.]|jgi:DNA-binding NarL/FixJ family response regulator|nr:response regulator transcription factor [Prevotella sp.]
MDICKVLVADDHELILTAICNILTNRFSIDKDSISVFTSSGQVLNETRNTRYDLYILDLEFRELSGFDLIQSIREKDRDAKIIICTMHQEVWNINRLLEADVDGVILKNSANIYLEQAINCVAKGGKFLCPKFKEVQYKSQVYKNKIKKHVLTDREKEVLKLVVDGYSSKEIASLLGISENGVEKHRKNLYLKLDVENVVQLVRVAIYHRLVEI